MRVEKPDTRKMSMSGSKVQSILQSVYDEHQCEHVSCLASRSQGLQSCLPFESLIMSQESNL